MKWCQNSRHAETAPHPTPTGSSSIISVHLHGTQVSLLLRLRPHAVSSLVGRKQWAQTRAPPHQLASPDSPHHVKCVYGAVSPCPAFLPRVPCVFWPGLCSVSIIAGRICNFNCFYRHFSSPFRFGDHFAASFGQNMGAPSKPTKNPCAVF
jgi:hypothetical protein